MSFDIALYSAAAALQFYWFATFKTNVRWFALLLALLFLCLAVFSWSHP